MLVLRFFAAIVACSALTVAQTAAQSTRRPPTVKPTQLTLSDVVGRYQGQWATDDRGTLELKPDGTYVWTPARETLLSQHRGGVFDIHKVKGEWQIELLGLDEDGHKEPPPLHVTVPAGRVLEIPIDPRRGFVLRRR